MCSTMTRLTSAGSGSISKVSSGACVGLEGKLASLLEIGLGLEEGCVLRPEAGGDVNGPLSLSPFPHTSHCYLIQSSGADVVS